jgi:hypothetical protein
MNNTQDILLQIQAIIGSRNGKERDVADFLTLIEMQALVDLIESLPPEKQKQVTEQFVTLPDEPQKAEKILSPYYTREQMRETLREATKKAIVQHIVEPHNHQLSPSQRKRILSLLEQLT